jgi:hypothetical protein
MQCIVSWDQDLREGSLSLIDSLLLLTIGLCASGIRAIYFQKGCRSGVRNGAIVGSKDNGLTGHLAGVVKGLQLYRVDLRVSSREGRCNKERAEKKRREGHVEGASQRLCEYDKIKVKEGHAILSANSSRSVIRLISKLR